ncbi:MAG: glycosyltransferase family 2 protein, partial [Rikenellaceae bacterium]
EGNRGKGAALKTGLAYATQKGFRYAITIDSDGQHFADDIPQFMEQIRKTPDALIIGARNLTAENMPSKNTFANKFSNFWYKVETGKSLTDTQSGYRLYPLDKLRDMKFFTPRYEFEVEIIVRAAWRGKRVTCFTFPPISGFYPYQPAQ